MIDYNNLPQFKDLLSFAQWYIESGTPIILPIKREVFISDDATSTTLFRHGRYQVEMYLIHPDPVIPEHEHPGVENIEFSYSHYQDTNSVGEFDLENHLSKPGTTHGLSIRRRAQHDGFCLLSIQKWDEELEMSTIGSRWKGHTAGPKHEALIRRFNPDCLIYTGYADVTQKQIKKEIL